jgi:hypothetical protein
MMRTTLNIRYSSPLSRLRAAATVAVLCWASTHTPLRAQWTGGPTGPISYTGGSVGIGTATTYGLLHLKAAGDTGDAFAGIRFYPAAGDGSGLFNYNLITGYRHSGLAISGSTSGNYAKSYVFLNDSGINIATSDGNSDPTTNVKLVVTNAGNVGIGTTAPVGPLHISGAGAGTFPQASTAIFLHNTDTTAGNNATLAFNTTDSSGARVQPAWVTAYFTNHNAGSVQGLFSHTR